MRYWLSIMVVLLFFSIACSDENLLEFKVSGSVCGDRPEESSVTSQYDKGYLTTVANVVTNCAAIPAKPSYEISGDTLIYRLETVSPAGIVAKCLCNNTVTFKLAADNERALGFANVAAKNIKVQVFMDGEQIK
ncbi:MAG: hypothetical protein GY874_17390 [Desulfobacteraceae bacterium]|nr:hypothetical protein [Desulfobacteraceae bacterium]